MPSALIERPAPRLSADQHARSTLREHYRRRANSRNLRADLLEALSWTSMAVAVALYLAGGVAGSFATVGDAMVTVGILAGLTATNALLLMLLLAARVDVIDRTLGQPRVMALHARLGDWVVIGLGVHGAFLIVGYALRDQTSLLAEFTTLWGTTGDFALALLGMGLLLTVVVSSITAARRHLPYEVWHVIHLLSYLAVAVSIPHMYSMGSIITLDTWQGWYWTGLLIVTGVSLLSFRFLLPLLNTLRHRVRVSRVVPAGPDAFSIEFSGHRLDELGMRAGQYLHWRFLTPRLWWHQHPFSVSAAPTDGAMRITVRIIGKGTAALAGVRPGTRVAIEGPYGVFSDDARTTESVALIGAGAGICPIRAILEDTGIVPGRATVILRASRPEEFYLVDEIAELCRLRGARLVTLAGHRAEGRWVPADHSQWFLHHFIPDLTDTDIYVCGPAGFTTAVVDEALALGVPKTRIRDERFDW